jgi:hypothetical protein
MHDDIAEALAAIDRGPRKISPDLQKRIPA